MTTGTLPGAAIYSSGPVTLLLGATRDVLGGMPAGSVHCVVTSPPPYGLPGCGPAGQYGCELSPQVYVDRLRGVFREIRRVLAADATLWLRLGDSYVSGPARQRHPSRLPGRFSAVTTPEGSGGRNMLPAGSLLGMPWRVAFALQADGWILRNAIVWPKLNAMPERTQDRLSSDHEYVFLLVKHPRYWFDLDAIREPLRRPDVAAHPPPVGGRQGAAGCTGSSARRRPGQSCRHPKYQPAALAFRGRPHGTHIHPTGQRHTAAHPRGRNPGDVWASRAHRRPQEHSAAHRAGFPLSCIAAGCRPGGTVLDPFSGAATTGLAAIRLDRRYIGIDIDPAQHELAKARLSQAPLDPAGSGSHHARRTAAGPKPKERGQ